MGEIFQFFWFFTSKTALFFIFLLVRGLIQPVCFLIVSAGFLILSADAIRESADSLIVSASRKAGWVACSFLWRILWLSWEGESRKIVDVFKPTNFHERGEESRIRELLPAPL